MERGSNKKGSFTDDETKGEVEDLRLVPALRSLGSSIQALRSAFMRSHFPIFERPGMFFFFAAS